jgi:hypothetical protein
MVLKMTPELAPISSRRTGILSIARVDLEVCMLHERAN